MSKNCFKKIKHIFDLSIEDFMLKLKSIAIKDMTKKLNKNNNCIKN